MIFDICICIHISYAGAFINLWLIANPARLQYGYKGNITEQSCIIPDWWHATGIWYEIHTQDLDGSGFTCISNEPVECAKRQAKMTEWDEQTLLC